MKTGIAYCRTSTQNQKANETIQAQISECRRLISSHGVELIPYGPKGDGWVIDDGLSGTLLQGRGLGQLLGDLRSGTVKPDVLIVYSLTRLSRVDSVSKDPVKVLESYAAEAQIKATLVSCGVKVLDGEGGEYTPGSMMFGLKTMFANEEFRVIRERTMMGKADRLGKNLYARGGKPPFGYAQIAVNGVDRRQGFTLARHPEDAPNLQRILDWFIAGGVTHAARMATEAKLPTPMNRTTSRKNQASDWTPERWSPVSIQHIVRNAAAYLGSQTYVYNGEAYTLSYPPLITPTQYAAIMKRTKETTLKRRATVLSTGFVDCSCGAHLHAKNSHDRHFATCAKKCGRMPEEHFERHLWTAAVCRLIQIRQHEGATQNEDTYEAGITEAKAKVAACAERIAALLDLYLAKDLSKSDFTSKRSVLDSDRAKAQAQLDQLTSAKRVAQERRSNEATVEARVRSVIAELSIATPNLERKREVLRDILNGHRVIVGWVAGGVTLTLPAFGSLPAVTVSSLGTIWNDMLGGFVTGHHVSTKDVGKGLEASEMALLATVTGQGGKVLSRRTNDDGSVSLTVEVPASYEPG